MIKIGWIVYRNGEIFLLNLFRDNIELVRNINKLLLIGYYLANIGYAIITIAYWPKITSTYEILSSLSTTLGKIILMLAILHYNNIFWLKQITNSKIINK